MLGRKSRALRPFFASILSRSLPLPLFQLQAVYFPNVLPFAIPSLTQGRQTITGIVIVDVDILLIQHQSMLMRLTIKFTSFSRGVASPVESEKTPGDATSITTSPNELSWSVFSYSLSAAACSFQLGQID